MRVFSLEISPRAGDLPPEATVDAHGVLEGELPLELGALIDEGREAARR
jgi:hypothetical protein